MQYFPVIDRFEGGIATSIKSIDLHASTYQDVARLARTVQKYIDAVHDFRSATWAKVIITQDDIVGRELIVAIPPGATPAQMATLQGLQGSAASLGVVLRIVIVR